MLEALVAGGPPDDVLFRSVVALRRMGARITRYDAETLTLEARLPRRLGETLLRLRALEEGPRQTRLVIERERASGLSMLVSGGIIRRFARELDHTTASS